MTNVEPPLTGPLRACSRGFYPTPPGIKNHARFHDP